MHFRETPQAIKVGMEVDPSNQMLLFQASKSPTINSFLVTYKLLPILRDILWQPWHGGGEVGLAEENRWREVREAEGVGVYNRIRTESAGL